MKNIQLRDYQLAKHQTIIIFFNKLGVQCIWGIKNGYKNN